MGVPGLQAWHLVTYLGRALLCSLASPLQAAHALREPSRLLELPPCPLCWDTGADAMQVL